MDRYESPLTSRYASRDMAELFSERKKIVTWRKLWTELARAESELGLPVTKEQVEELEAHIEDIDFEAAEAREKTVRHDVMAHVYAYGLAAPNAKPILHLGATSCYVKDNADLILYRDALRLLRKKLVAVIRAFSSFALRYRALPTLGSTHYQAAQPVTYGKRAALWMQDFLSDLTELDHVLETLPFLGCRGTTGTEASFLTLFNGEEEKVDALNGRIAARFDFQECIPIAGQTYPRKTDTRIVSMLAGIGESAAKFATDLRLLMHDGEVAEPFETGQIGSSAMAYKQNPMRSERIVSLSRLLRSHVSYASETAAAQWLERTLDDSAGRRMVMPESFLLADGILKLVYDVISGLTVFEHVVRRRVNEKLPFLATETVLMECVKRGKDRQEAHEAIRKITIAAAAAEKEGKTMDLTALLADQPEIGLTEQEIRALFDPDAFIGRSAHQTESFVRSVLDRPDFSGAADDTGVFEEVAL